MLQGQKHDLLIRVLSDGHLFLKLKGHLYFYADDAILIYDCNSIEQLRKFMQHDIDLIVSWLNRNVLSINPTKTFYMFFGRTRLQNYIQIDIRNTHIKRVKTFKYLGLVLDEELSFKNHVDLVKQNIRPFIPFMWRSIRYVPANLRKSLYYSYVFSHLNYILPIYGKCPDRCLKSLLCVPLRASTTYLYSSSFKILYENQCNM